MGWRETVLKEWDGDALGQNLVLCLNENCNFRTWMVSFLISVLAVPLLCDDLYIYAGTPVNTHEENRHLKRWRLYICRVNIGKYQVHLIGNHKGLLLHDRYLGLLKTYKSCEVLKQIQLVRKW